MLIKDKKSLLLVVMLLLANAVSASPQGKRLFCTDGTKDKYFLSDLFVRFSGTVAYVSFMKIKRDVAIKEDLPLSDYWTDQITINWRSMWPVPPDDEFVNLGYASPVTEFTLDRRTLELVVAYADGYDDYIGLLVAEGLVADVDTYLLNGSRNYQCEILASLDDYTKKMDLIAQKLIDENEGAMTTRGNKI